MIKNFQVKKYFLFNTLNLIGFIINFGLLYYLNLNLLDELFGIFFISSNTCNWKGVNFFLFVNIYLFFKFLNNWSHNDSKLSNGRILQ